MVLIVVVFVLRGAIETVHLGEGSREVVQHRGEALSNTLGDFCPSLVTLGADRGLLLLLLLLGGLGVVPDLYHGGARDHGLGAQRFPEFLPALSLPEPHYLRFGGVGLDVCIVLEFRAERDTRPSSLAPVFAYIVVVPDDVRHAVQDGVVEHVQHGRVHGDAPRYARR